MVLTKTIIGAIIRDLESKGFEMERDNGIIILSGEKGIIDITEEDNTISINIQEL